MVSPTLGGSKFEYTSGGSCGRACNTRPRIGTSTCGATDIYLRCYHLRGGRTFEYTSGGSCGCACIIPPKNWDIYLRCYRHLPAVLKRAYPAWDVYLRWLLHRAWQDACHLENYLRCYRLHGGCAFEYTSGGSCGCACIIPPKNWDIYLRCYRHLPAVLKRAYPAWDVYLRWLLHRAWQDACHLENYLRCYRLHGGCAFEYTSGGSCGCACIIPPKSRGHLPPVGQRCLPAVLLVFTSGGFAYTRRE